jgi:hypothetical protein
MGAVTNYSAEGQGKGVAMTVTATVGYDVDWRTVHKTLDRGCRPNQTDRYGPSSQSHGTGFWELFG